MVEQGASCVAKAEHAVHEGQTDAPAAAVKVPSAQLVHTVCAGALLKVPAAQPRHAIDCGAEAYVPAEHVAHIVAPVVALKVPGVQFPHTEALALLNEPG